MIKRIYKKLKENLTDQRDVSLEIRMSPSIFNECKYCDYQEVITAFNMSPSSPMPTTMFSHRLVIDFDLDDDEWLIQTPTVK